MRSCFAEEEGNDPKGKAKSVRSAIEDRARKKKETARTRKQSKDAKERRYLVDCRLRRAVFRSSRGGGERRKIDQLPLFVSLQLLLSLSQI